MKKGSRKLLSNGVSTVVFFVSFIPYFLVYHIFLCGFFPVDSEGYIIAPVWYVPLGFLFATAAAFTTAFFIKKHLSKKIDAAEQTTSHSPEPPSPAFSSPVQSQSIVYTQPESQSYGSKIEDIDFMDGLDFEHWCADLLRKNSFVNVEVTRGSGDQGVDILAEKEGVKYAIQCKNYSTDLGNKPVQEVNTGKVIYHCHIAAVMTNRYFTHGGKEAAAATGVLLWDRDWIKQHLPQDLPQGLETTVTTAPPQVTSYSSQRDELFSFAVEIVLSTRSASISTLQHRLDIGYARAARIIDQIEDAGIIGPFRGSKPRDILITLDQWYDGSFGK